MKRRPSKAPRARSLRTQTAILGSAALIGVLAAGCLDRPVAPQQPATVRLITKQYQATRIDKIDLLFMIDNSASMADKQDILADAVPDLVKRLTQPRCLSKGVVVAKGADGKCPTGSKFEFEPINDIHVGVITSSLGGPACADTAIPESHDMAQLISRKKGGGSVTTYQGNGFLAWDPEKKATPPGESDASVLIQNFTDVVRGAGQTGCGFEASLEAWYRFLVDPAPYKELVKVPCDPNVPEKQECLAPNGIDDAVLKNRADFLRPDSLVAVVMLTDENDCSIINSGQAPYIQVDAVQMPVGNAACQTNPASPDCRPCEAGSEDPVCQAGYTKAQDQLNLRCFRQKQRFGADLLWPVKRYVNGLSRVRFQEDDINRGFNQGFRPGQDINPLFCSEYEEMADPDNPGSTIPDRTRCKSVLRDQRLVFFAGILGVPWQDVAVDPNDLKKGYRPVTELGWKQSDFASYNKEHSDEPPKTVPGGVDEQVTVWDQILGKVDQDLNIDFTVDPLDAFMIDSVMPRNGRNPATGESLAPPSSGTPLANRINGHEWNPPGSTENPPRLADLQYACTFKLPPGKERECHDPNANDCDCATAEGQNNPLCQSETGSYGITQYRAKAYPGRRQLAVLKGIDPNQAIVASICAENTTDPSAADYGYSPAIGAIIDRLATVLQGACWSQELDPDTYGQVPCVVLEASKGVRNSDGTYSCKPCAETPSRTEPSEQARTSLSSDTTFVGNGLHCICEIQQAAKGEELDQCIGSPDDSPTLGDGTAVNGWCYIDPAVNGGKNEQLVQGCSKDQKRMIRFVNAGAPAYGSLTYLQCRGATF